MRKSGVPAALLRARVRLAAPGPSMSVSPVVSLRSGRTELSVIVPVTLKLIMSSPLFWLAWVMAVAQVAGQVSACASVAEAIDSPGRQERRLFERLEGQPAA